MLNKLFLEIKIYFLSDIFGVSEDEMRKILNRGHIKNPKNKEISINIDTVSEQLLNSKKIIDDALVELETQKKLFEKAKKEAEISQQISTLNEAQLSALSNILEKTLDKQEKKELPKNLVLDIIICVIGAILGAIIGFLMGKYL